jgi:uncharacterized protein YcgI (DUF1989 family)
MANRSKSQREAVVANAKASAELAVSHFLANQEMEETKVYLEAGRAFSGLDDLQLDGAYVQAFRTWAASNTSDRAESVALDHVRAECRLRHREPPHHLLKAEIADVIELVKERIDELSADQILEVGEQVNRDFLEMTESKN